jgi:hypothetical protein
MMWPPDRANGKDARRALGGQESTALDRSIFLVLASNASTLPQASRKALDSHDATTKQH